jgi:hypothetical protein
MGYNQKIITKGMLSMKRLNWFVNLKENKSVWRIGGGGIESLKVKI